MAEKEADQVPGRKMEGPETARAWIEKRWGEYRKCPYCRGNEWTVIPAITLAPGADGEPDHEVFPVTCNLCGNTALINAIFPRAE